MEISEESLRANILELVRKNQTSNCTARIQISRGTGPRGYLPPENSKATWSITLHPATELPLKQPHSWNVIVSKMRMPSHWKCAQWKTTNKLFQILIKQEARESNADDAIILNESDHITELSCANLFLVMNDRILTPSIESGILPGTTRALVLDILKQIGIEFQETTCDMETLKEASSVFATLSTRGLIHINRIQDKTFESHPMEQAIYDVYLEQLNMKP